MKPTLLWWGLLLGIAACSAVPKTDRIARGRYLVEEVTKCQDCHTPRTANGEMDRSRWLKGGKLDFRPMHEIPAWHPETPDLTRTSRLWMKWGEGALIRFLTTGAGPSGKPADPPMPAYKLNPEDAEAIVDYLNSLW